MDRVQAPGEDFKKAMLMLFSLNKAGHKLYIDLPGDSYRNDQD